MQMIQFYRNAIVISMIILSFLKFDKISIFTIFIQLNVKGGKITLGHNNFSIQKLNFQSKYLYPVNLQQYAFMG